MKFSICYFDDNNLVGGLSINLLMATREKNIATFKGDGYYAGWLKGVADNLLIKPHPFDNRNVVAKVVWKDDGQE